MTRRCPWAIQYTEGWATRCDSDDRHPGDWHTGPGQHDRQIWWLAGDRREFVTIVDHPGPWALGSPAVRAVDGARARIEWTGRGALDGADEGR